MDIFTDVDLFCDLLEASLKRKVPVYILLDEKNLSNFTDMCNTLDIQHSHLNVSQDILSGTEIESSLWLSFYLCSCSLFIYTLYTYISHTIL